MKKLLYLFHIAVFIISMVGAIPSLAQTHSSSEPTWNFFGVVTNDASVKMKHLTVVHDPYGLIGVPGNPEFMMWWSPGGSNELYAATSSDGIIWSGTGTSRTKLLVNFPSSVVPIYHPEVIYDSQGFEKKKSLGDVHFKMWFYDGGQEHYNWIRYAESADGLSWQVFEDSPNFGTNPSPKNYLEFSGGSGNEMSVLYRQGGTGIIINGIDQEYVGYQATSIVGISDDGAWFHTVTGQGGGPTDVCTEMIIAGEKDNANYRGWDPISFVKSYDSLTGLSWNSPAAGDPPINGAAWSDFYGAMSVVVVGNKYYMYDTMDSEQKSVGLLIASYYEPTFIKMASFIVKEAKIDFKKKPDDDKINVKGKFVIDLISGDDVDVSETVIVTIGPYSETIMMEGKGKGDKWEYNRPKGETGIKEMKIDWKKDEAKFDIKIDKLEDMVWSNPVTITLQIGDDFGSETITMNVKKDKWEYK